MKAKAFLALLLCLALLCGCEQQPQATDAIPTGELPTLPADTQQAPSGDYVTVAESGLFTDRDYETGYDASEAVKITLSGSSIAAGSGVTVSGTTATITEEGTYILSGSLSDGMIIVDTGKKDKVQLYLSGASIHSEDCAAIYVRQADKVFITTAAGTENTLSGGSSFTAMDGNDIDSVIFSKDDLTLNGAGTLIIDSPAGHGVVSKDELTVTSGTYQITAASHGMVGKDNVCIDGASINVNSGKDGIRANNDDDTALGFVYIKSGSFGLICGGDGISASNYLQLDGGSYSILCGGGSANGEQHTDSMGGGMGGGRPGMGGGRPGSQSSGSAASTDTASTKGMKATGNLVINGGVFSIDTADDAIHGNLNVVITSGNFLISTGDDGVHADEALTVSGGSLIVTASYEGLEGLTISVEGGEHALVCSDDGLNAAGGTDQSGMGGFRPGADKFGGDGSADSLITISGGELYINASGDGIDSNGYLTISGGHTTVCGPTQGDTAVLDYGLTGTITGGTFIGTGSYMMAQTFTTSENQGVIALSVGNQSAGTHITLADAQGNILMDVTPEENFAIVILSCPEMRKGESYTVTVGTLTDSFEAS